MRRAVRARALFILSLASLFGASSANADAGWFQSGDSMLRIDLQLLNDAGVILIPFNEWPLPRAAVQYALANAKEHLATNAAVQAALARVRARADTARRTKFDSRLSVGESGKWRDFDTLARDPAELEARASYDGDRFAAGLSVTAVADPADGDSVRADGSHVTVQWGNWLLSANTLDRWWGPSHDGNLILSNNARPIPTVMVERAAAIPFETRWLSWLGPWRFSLGFGQMENQRDDIDAPLFMAWRVAIMPFRKIELGFSRTAQFCGDELSCDWNTFGNMLAGNDNVGIDARPETEPGNQMAGFDIRWNSPIGNLPYAIYSQAIGEDESSYTPAKFLMQFGAEYWMTLPSGGVVQAFAEYSSTTCSANTNRGPYYNCAYNQGRFNAEGYRYLGRVIGHTSDRDAESYSAGATYVAADGGLWSGTLRRSRLNRDDYDDVRNTMSTVPADYHAVEFGWKGRMFGESVSLDLGVERYAPEIGETDVNPFGFVGWRHDFH